MNCVSSETQGVIMKPNSCTTYFIPKVFLSTNKAVGALFYPKMTETRYAVAAALHSEARGDSSVLGRRVCRMTKGR